MEEFHPAILRFYVDLDAAIASAERMGASEGGSVHDHMRWAVEGLTRARRIMDRAIEEALHEGKR